MKVGILEKQAVKDFAGLTDQSILDNADIVLGVSVQGGSGENGESYDLAAGIMAVKLYGTYADVLDFYVAPEYRRKGAGSELLKIWNELAYHSGVDSVIFSYDREECADLDAFLEEQDAVLGDSLEVLYSFTLQDLSEQVKEPVTSGADVISLAELSEEEFEQAKMILGNLSVKEKTSLCQELSFVAKSKGKICGVIFLSKSGENYTIDALGIPDKAYVKELMEMIHTCFEKLSSVCKEETKLFARAIHVDAAAMISKITDGKAVEENHIVSRYIAY